MSLPRRKIGITNFGCQHWLAAFSSCISLYAISHAIIHKGRPTLPHRYFLCHKGRPTLPCSYFLCNHNLHCAPSYIKVIFCAAATCTVLRHTSELFSVLPTYISNHRHSRRHLECKIIPTVIIHTDIIIKPVIISTCLLLF